MDCVSVFNRRAPRSMSRRLDLKHQVQRAAQEQLITEPVWLRRLVAYEVSSSVRSLGARTEEVVERDTGETKDARLYIRLRPQDALLLRRASSCSGNAVRDSFVRT